MNFVALRMLMGDKAKYVGIIFGVAFASMLMTQQGAIFAGLMQRSFAFLTDTPQPDIWVMDPKVQFIDDLKPLQDTMLYRVRGVEGVEWALPLYKGLLKVRLDNGSFQTCHVLGIDDATLTGGPPEMVEGSLADLRRSDSVIIDDVGAATRLARPAPIDPATGKPTGPPTPLRVGDYVEINDHRAVVVGLCKSTTTFQNQPVIYTTYTRATTFAPRERRLMTFVIAEAKAGQDVGELCERIAKTTGLAAMSGHDFKAMTFWYFMKYTGIPINFGISVGLGFLVGTVIAGMMFYNFTVDNLKQFGALKAMGTGNLRLLRMILVQALVVGLIGYGIGVGIASLFGQLSGRTQLAFNLLWYIPLITGVAVTFICIVASLLSIFKVMRLEPAIVFKG